MNYCTKHSELCENANAFGYCKSTACTKSTAWSNTHSSNETYNLTTAPKRDATMNKAILVIDMPESCDKCPLFHGFYADMTCGANNYSINYPYPKDFRQDWCPLKPLPEKKLPYTASSDYLNGFAAGYNVCVHDAIDE